MVSTRNLDQYATIHSTKRYGESGRRKLPFIEPWVRLRRPQSVLDYGAGQSFAVKELRCSSIKVRDRYDPAIPAISTIPRSRYDFVTCIDVMEHIDEHEVPSILADISRVTDDAVFVVDMKPANAILPNGENAHATVRPAEWWVAKIAETFPQAELGTVFKARVLVKT